MSLGFKVFLLHVRGRRRGRHLVWGEGGQRFVSLWLPHLLRLDFHLWIKNKCSHDTLWDQVQSLAEHLKHYNIGPRIVPCGTPISRWVFCWVPLGHYFCSSITTLILNRGSPCSPGHYFGSSITGFL